MPPAAEAKARGQVSFALQSVVATCVGLAVTTASGVAADGQAPVRVEVAGFQVKGDGPRLDALKAATPTLATAIASCAEAEIQANPKYPPTFKCYSALVLGKDGKIDEATSGGQCTAFADCIEARAVGIDIKAKSPTIERFTLYFMVLNRIPPKDRPKAPPAPTQGRDQDAQRKEDPGVLEQIGHAYMENVRAEERRVQKQADDSRRASSNASSFKVIAPAPIWVARHKLGRPVNATFEEISGPDGKSLFSSELPPKTKLSVMKIERLITETIDDFHASARGWGFSASYDKVKQSMFFIHRATHILESEEVDDTNPVRKAPPGAKFFLKRIYYGRSFEMYSMTDKSTVDTKVRGDLFQFTGKLEDFSARFKMSVTISSRGLQPVAGALFDSGKDDFQKRYVKDADAGDIVPILVEYATCPD